MPRIPRQLRRFLPFVISIALIIVLIGYAPWNDVGDILDDLTFTYLLTLFLLSVAYYSLKTVRFWYLLKAMEIHQPFRVVALSYISAQPVSILPGGELYRSRELERHTGVPIKRSVAQFTMQGLLEGAAMATLAIISALFLGKLRIPFICLGILVILGIVAIYKGGIANAGRVLNKLPFVEVHDQTLEKLSHRHREVLRWRWFSLLYGISIVVEIVGSAIAYFSVAAVGGHIGIPQAVLAYVIPIIIGFVSLLPAGLGISEQSAIGIMLLSNIKIATAVAGTLLMRVSIVGTGLVYGGVALLWGQRRLKRLQPAGKKA
ncbi:MAG TPA: lysylphosphatidylglycerol synthase transmembrane domain-containing protein [Candidatus Saccharimonadales bacterium]|nr:lysylphosphatidylglycerol synthase transmembrane domain-containing protein [Candidatus Saccharimonadales bacterium]